MNGTDLPVGQRIRIADFWESESRGIAGKKGKVITPNRNGSTVVRLDGEDHERWITPWWVTPEKGWPAHTSERGESSAEASEGER